MAKQKRSSEITISRDGWNEIDNILEDFKRGLIIGAAGLAHKDGHEIVDRTYIQKVSKRLRFPRSSTITWALRVTLALPITLAILQIGSLTSLSLLHQTLLWILPIFLFIWVPMITLIFKDYL